MAFDRAAGYTNLVNGNFTPQIFSQKVLKFFRRASVVEDITNTDYAGEIENFGDTVKIIKEPAISVSAYNRGTTVNTQDLVDDQITLTVDQGSYFAFKVDDIEERQSHINFEALSTSSGAYALKKAYDNNVLGNMVSGAGIAGTGGSVSTVSTLGYNTSPADLNTTDANEAADYLALCARVLDDQDVPEENRFFVGSPIFYEYLSLAGAKLIDSSVTGDASSPIRNGRVTDGLVRGFNLYKSNAFAAGDSTATDVTVTGTANEYYVLFGHMSSTCTASHIAKTEVVRDPDSFADIVRGLHVYGRKVIRPEALGVGVVSFT